MNRESGDLRELPCPDCGDSLFEQPECEDGHGDGCPEWMCVECGTALFVEPSNETIAPPRRLTVHAMTDERRPHAA